MPDLRGIFLRLPIAAIPIFEFITYFLIGVGLLGWALYEAHLASKGLLNIYGEATGLEIANETLMTKNIFGFVKDNTDFEWKFWSSFLVSWCKWSLMYVAIGALLQDVMPAKVHLCVRIGVAFCALASWCEPAPACGLFLIVSVAYLLLRAPRRIRTFALWVYSICIIQFINTQDIFPTFQCWLFSFTKTEASTPLEVKYNFLSLCIFLYSMLVMRILSAGTSWDVSDNGLSVLDFFHYCFYFPTLCVGPLQTWKDFSQQFKSRPKLRARVSSAWPLALRSIIWLAVSEIILQLIFVQGLLGASWYFVDLNRWAQFGTGAANGLFIQTKYFVMFGLPGAMARLDGITPWGPPKCILWIFHYSAMWPAFDTGLYEILKSVIYIPLGGSRHGLLRQFFAASITFSFICFWHGASLTTLWWCFLNYLGIQVEVVFRYLEKRPPISKWKASMSPVWWRRLYCLVNVPLWAYYIIAIFLSFGGPEVGKLYLERFVIDGNPLVWLLGYVILYCGIQFSVEYQRFVLMKAENKIKKS